MKKLTSLILTLMLVFSFSLNISAAATVTKPAENTKIHITNAEAAKILLNAAGFYNPAATAKNILGELKGSDELIKGNALIMTHRAFGTLPEPTDEWLIGAAEKPEFTDISSEAATELATELSLAVENLGNARIILDADDSGLLKPEELFSEQDLTDLLRRIYHVYGTNLADDFHATINHEIFKEMEVNPGFTSAGAMPNAAKLAEDQMAELLAKLAEGEFEQGSDEQTAADFYKAFLKLGEKEVNIAHFEKVFRLIDEAESAEEINRIYLAMIEQMGYQGIVTVATTDNMRGDGKVIYFLVLPELALKDAESGYEAEKTYEAAKNYNQDFLTLIGDSDPETNAEAVTAFEKNVAAASLSANDKQNTEKAFVNHTIKEIQAKLPNWNLTAIADALSLGATDDRLIMVADEGRLDEFAKLFLPENLETLKTFFKLDITRFYRDYMGDSFRKAYAAFKRNSIGEEPLPKDEYYVSKARDAMHLLMQKLYVKYYVDERTKADVEKMAQGAIDTFLKRMDTYTWMNESTREEAKKKLLNLRVIAVSPDDMSSPWDDVTATSDNAYLIYRDYLKALVKFDGGQYGENVNKDISIMTTMKTYDANAMYIPSYSLIYFPAGLLTAPYYDPDATLEENLGAIGAVMGHEISHAFDNNGANYDGDGLVRNWWTEKDYTEFGKRVDSIIEHFDGYEAVPGYYNNPELTVSENIADIAGLSVVLEYLKDTEENPDLDKFFRSFASAWSNARVRQRAIILASDDVHSAYWLRVNKVVQVFDEFYEVYGIKEGDEMYLSPEDRVSIW